MGIEQAWLIPVYCFAAFAVLSLFRQWLPWQGKHLSIIAVIAGFVSFWPVLFDFLGRGVGEYHIKDRVWFTVGDLTVGWGNIVDPLTIVMLALVTFVSAAVQVYSLGYMQRHEGGATVDDPRVGWYFAAHSLFTASMLMLVLADNLLLLYVAWELVGLCSYLLIGYWWERRSAAEAAKKAFITTRIGDVGLLIGILLLAAETGTFDITEILTLVTEGDLNSAVVTASAFLIFFGAMGKSAQFPLHVWLPDAMEGPSPVSALIHAATMVTAGVFLVARLLPLYEAVPSAQLTVAIVGIVTALMGAAMALTATDLKRILAYSTMSHLGFMMLALGAGGLLPAIFHLLMHGVAKAMLFLGAGAVMHSMHEETDIRKMGGLRRRMPVTAATFTVGALALAGIAPLSGFWSKDEILLVVKDELSPVFLVLFLVAAALSALYMARAVYTVFFGTLKDENRDVHESPLVMKAPVAVLGVLTLVIGLIVLPLRGGYDGIGSFLYEAAVTPWDAAAHGPHEFEFSIAWTAASSAMAFGGLLLGLWLYGKRRDIVDSVRERFAPVHRLLVERFYMDHAYQWLIDQVVLRLGSAVAWLDRKVVNDGGVNGAGLSVLESGKRLRYHVTGVFADYGLAMVAGAGAIAVFFWLRT